MKVVFFLTVVWFCLLFGESIPAESSAAHLNLNRPPPRAGDEFETTVQFISSTSDTNLASGREEITNSSSFLELQGREKIVDWDTADDSSKIEITLNHLIAASDNQTNELVRPGTQISGQSVLGESFFQSKSGTLPATARETLEKICNIRPQGFNEFAGTKIPQPVSIGQIWEISAPTNIEAMAGFLGASFTDNVKATGQFIGTTNLFGCDCFHLQFHIVSTELPESLKSVITSHLPVEMKTKLELTVDLITPFDTAKDTLLKSYSMNFSMNSHMLINGKVVMPSRGKTALKIIEVFRPIPH